MSQIPHIRTLFIIFVLVPLSLFVACNVDPNSLEVSDATLAPSLTITQTATEETVPQNLPVPTATVTSEKEAIITGTTVPTALPTPILTLTPSLPAEKLYRMAYGTFFDFLSVESSNVANREVLDRAPNIGEQKDQTVLGPAYAYKLAFAHYADLMVYWTQGDVGQLWLSDLNAENPQLLFTDEMGRYSLSVYGGRELNLSWTPDDQHVILDDVKGDQESLIYHVEHGVIEPWPWYCDRVARSPLTSRFAIWCVSVNYDGRFAVIEWQEEIWYSDQPPTEELFHFDAAKGNHWAWSADGQRIAYFDPADVSGSLTIVDETGEKVALFPGSAWWSTTAVEDSKMSIPSILLQWSQTGTHLLLFAHSLTLDSCPLWAGVSAPGPEVLYARPC